MTSGKKVAVWLSVAVVLSVAGYFGYKYYQKKKAEKGSSTSGAETTATTTTTEEKKEVTKPFVKNGGGIPEQTTPKPPSKFDSLAYDKKQFIGKYTYVTKDKAPVWNQAIDKITTYAPKGYKAGTVKDMKSKNNVNYALLANNAVISTAYLSVNDPLKF